MSETRVQAEPRLCEACGKPVKIKRRPTRFCCRVCSNKHRALGIAERFWRKVDKNGPTPAHRPDLGPCWPWTAYRNGKGYGRRAAPGDTYAHRLAYALAYGPVPAGLWVLHRCDNPPCCNPAHLFLGTNMDNMRDMAEKGRRVPLPGARNGRAKLDAGAVAEIRTLYAAGAATQRELAQRFGVTRPAIGYVVRCRTWLDA